MKTQRRIVKNSKSVKIGLPKSFIEALGLVINGIVNLELKGNKIIITKDTKKKEVEKVG